MDDNNDELEKINNLYQQFHILNLAIGTNSKDINDMNKTISFQMNSILYYKHAIKTIINQIETLKETNNTLEEKYNDLRNYMAIFIISFIIFLIIIAK